MAYDYKLIKFVYKSFIVIVFSAILVAVLTYIRVLYANNVPVSKKLIKDKKLNIVLFVNMSKDNIVVKDEKFEEYEKELINVLLNHNSLNYNLSIEGLVIDYLKWSDISSLNKLKKGVNEKQIELLGTSYTTHNFYANNEHSLYANLYKGKEKIEEEFKVKPTSIINTGEIWNKDLVNRLLKLEYKNLISLRSVVGKEKNYLKQFDLNNNNRIIESNNKINKKFNRIIKYKGYRNREELKDNKLYYRSFFSYLRTIYRLSDKNDYIGIEIDIEKLVTKKTSETGFDSVLKAVTLKPSAYPFIKNLDFILGELEKYPWIETSFVSDIKKSPKIKKFDNSKVYFDKNLNEKINIIYKDYKNIEQYSRLSPVIKFANYNLNSMNEYLKIDSKDDNIINFRELAIKNMIVCQKGLGDIGYVCTDENWSYEIRNSDYKRLLKYQIYKEIFKNLKNYSEKIVKEDLDGDKKDEIIVVKNKNLYIFSERMGGKLLYWYDLKNGVEIVGGDYTKESIGALNEEFTNNGATFSKEYIKLDDHNIIGKIEDYKIIFEYKEITKEVNFLNDGLEIKYDFPDKFEQLNVRSEFTLNSILNNEIVFDKKNSTLKSEKYNIGIKIENDNDSILKVEKKLFKYVFENRVKHRGTLKILKF